MQHSIIVRICKKIFQFIEKNYRLSFTRKMLIYISNTIKNFFQGSFIYKFFVSQRYDSPRFFQNSLIGRSEVLFGKILSILNSLYRKGIRGSFTLRFCQNIRGIEAGFYSLVIITAVLIYNLLSFINNRVYTLQLYVSGIIIFLVINYYFISKGNLYRNSFIKKIVDSIFYDAAKE